MIRKKRIATIITLILCLSAVGGTTTTFAATRTMNVNEWLEQCRSVANKIADEQAKYYHNGSATKSYDKNFNRKHLTKIHKKVKLNCADYTSWCLQRYQVLPVGQRFWVRGQQINGKDKKKVRKNKNIQQIMIAKKGVYASTLVKRKGTKSLKKGDLVSVVKKNGKGNHIQIYAGKEEKTGKLLWYMVNGGSICDKNGYLKRSRMLRTVDGQYNGNPRIAMILRIKGLKYVDYFRVTTSSDRNGRITGSHNVKWGNDDVLQITPKEGYQIKEITVNKKSADVPCDATTYTLENVRNPQSVRVTFEKVPEDEVIPEGNSGE